MASSKIEAEMIRATNVKQADNEPRAKYLLRLLRGGQKLTDPVWKALSLDAQAWYNRSVELYSAHDDPNDIEDFPDIAPVKRATLEPRRPTPPDEPAPVEETGDPTPIGEPEPEEMMTEEAVDFEEDQPQPEPEPEPEPAPVEAAQKPKPTPQKPKPAGGKPSRSRAKPKPEMVATGNGDAQAEPDAEISRPPKPAAPGAATMIKRLLLNDMNMTQAELLEKLRAKNISVTTLSVSTIRSDFRHSLKVLQEAGYCQELPPA